MGRFLSIGVIPAPIADFAPHGHETWEIVQYTYGRGIATIGEQRIPFVPGTIICMPPGIPHKEWSENGYTNIFMHTDRYPGNGRVPIFTDPPDRPFFNTAMMLHREFHLRESGWQALTQHLFDTLMMYLSRWEKRSTVHPLVDQLKAAIVRELPNPKFDLSDAIDEMPVSSDHLRRLFRQATGKTPLEYLTQLRMDEACQLLKVGGFSVKEIAARVGFSDPYYFSRTFKQVMKVSPTEYLAKLDNHHSHPHHHAHP
ncbi:MAG TPA: AraC family transcriptional regulator [Planctomycetota bacterium]|nr:AraC family transcriptional regulator [Planctomycetota bacterium]